MLSFLPGWDARTGGQSEGPASGGTSLAVSGYGFDASEVFACVFSADGHALSSPAVVVSHDALRCDTPAWGSVYSATTLVLTITKLVSGTPEGIAFTNGGLAPVAILPSACSHATCLFDVYPSWSALSISAGPASGGTLVEVIKP